MTNDQKSDPKGAPGPPGEQKKTDLDTLLAELGGGIRVTVHRLEPLWCDGYLGTLEVDDDDTISLENLRELFGGRKLKCKIINDQGNIVAVRTAKFPDNPRKDGIELKQPDPNAEKDKGGGGQSELMTMFLKSQETMVSMAREHNDAIQKMMIERLQDRSSPEPQNGSSGAHGLKDAMEIVDWVENLRDRVKDPAQDVNPLHAQMLGMAEKFFTMKLEQDQMTKEAELEKARAPELPERQTVESSKPTIDSFDDMTVLTHAAERFQNLPLAQQRQAAELFFKNINTDNATSGGDPKETVEYVENLDSTDNEDSAASLENQDQDLVLDPDDEAELKAEQDQGEIPTS